MSIIIAQKKENCIEFYADTQFIRSGYKDTVSKIDTCSGFTFGVAGDLAYLSILKYFLEVDKDFRIENTETFLMNTFTKIKKFSVEMEIANLNKSAFLIAYKNKLFEFCNFALIPRQIGFIGSGSNVARALVAQGLQPKEAIRKVSDYDVYVNNSVESVYHNFDSENK
jgi:hypothetical protein